MLVWMAKKEFPYDPLRPFKFPGDLPAGSDRSRSNTPDTPLEALQRAGPHAEPRVSKQERADLQAVVLDVIEALEPWEQWLLNALMFERMSLRQVEYVLGMPKTTVARKRDRILEKLRHDLFIHPLVREYLGVDSVII